MNPDRYFDPDPTQRAIARELYETVATLPLSLSARPRRSAPVCRSQLFFRLAGRSVDHSRSLRLPHVVLAGNCAGSAGRSAPRWGASRNRSPQDLADLRRSLLSVSRHAHGRVVQRRIEQHLRGRRKTDGRFGPAHLRSDRGETCHAGIPPARLVRALQHRSAVHHRCGHRSADAPSSHPRFWLDGQHPAHLPARWRGEPRRAGLAREHRRVERDQRHPRAQLRHLHSSAGESPRLLQVDGRHGHRSRRAHALHARTRGRIPPMRSFNAP